MEVLAPGCAPEAVRRAALAVGWALRQDGPVPATDLAREAHMRSVIDAAASGGRKVAALIGAFHAPALLDAVTPLGDDVSTEAADAAPGGDTVADISAPATAGAPTRPDPVAGSRAAAVVGSGPAAAGVRSGTEVPGPATVRTPGAGAPADPAPGPGGGERVVTSLVPYSFDLLDSRSGYPAGIRDPLWQQAVLEAGGDALRVRDAASIAVTGVCRELRRAGHTAGTGEAAETLRLACDLAVLRGLPAPGRGELLEAVTTVLGQGELFGRGRALARALETVLVGTARGRITPHAPAPDSAPPSRRSWRSCGCRAPTTPPRARSASTRSAPRSTATARSCSSDWPSAGPRTGSPSTWPRPATAPPSAPSGG